MLPCDGGTSILDLQDNEVDQAILNRIYASGVIVGLDDLDAMPTRNLVIIPYQTDDYPANPKVTKDTINRDFFARNTTSMSDYFLEVSYGQYWLDNAGVSDVVTIDGSSADFEKGQVGNDWTRNVSLYQQICQGSTINWARLDANKDFRITPNEAQVCIMAATGGSTLGCRPSAVTISYGGVNYVIDQRFVSSTCLSENDSREGTKGSVHYFFSQIAHELFHSIFCLPDRYTSYCESGGTGQFDIMSAPCRGIQHLNMHDKIKIGWVRPKVRMRTGVSAECLSFPASESTAAALIVNPVLSTTPAGIQCEYWIVENRFIDASSHNWDRGFPESGLCVWYVRETPGRQDEVYLIDAALPDGDPLLYHDQHAGTLFKVRHSSSVGSHVLYLGGGECADLGFGFVSAEGATMFAEF